MAGKHGKRKLKPKRFKVVRVDASVGTTERMIEKMLGLPAGSVHIRLPSKRKARSDKLIGKLLSDWGY